MKWPDLFKHEQTTSPAPSNVTPELPNATAEVKPVEPPVLVPKLAPIIQKSIVPAPEVHKHALLLFEKKRGLGHVADSGTVREDH